MRNDFGKEARAATISGWFKLYGRVAFFNWIRNKIPYSKCGKADDTPSPDSYFPEHEFGPKGTAPQYTFGGKSTFKGIILESFNEEMSLKILMEINVEVPTPGPLDYDVPQAFRKLKMGASCTIGSKTKGSSFIQETKGTVFS